MACFNFLPFSHMYIYIQHQRTDGQHADNEKRQAGQTDKCAPLYYNMDIGELELLYDILTEFKIPTPLKSTLPLLLFFFHFPWREMCDAISPFNVCICLSTLGDTLPNVVEKTPLSEIMLRN